MLERIQKANDIKDLKPEELPELAQEIRKRKGGRTAKVVLAAGLPLTGFGRLKPADIWHRISA